ncbi:MAG TPA: KH domain-containing protein [Dehalococcoidia bacterium]|nr:KH domain-containing protein [Dehalococcoidia bacterium]
MRELVLYIAQSLVDYPDQVRVTERRHDHTVILQLQVAPEDMGKVIGRQGRVAQAIRSLLKVAGTRERRRVVLEIV